MDDFGGQTVLITGSGTGIGLALAKVLATLGASVIILGRRREPLENAKLELDELASKAGRGAQIRVFSGVDVAKESDITAMFDTLERDGVKLDIVINNAGVSGPVTCFANSPQDEFESTISIHLTGTFWTSVQALRIMGEGGIILTISTFFTEERPLEQRPYRFRTPYTAAQGAKNRLTEALGAELVSKKIISIATNPGPVHSDRIYKTVYPKAAAEFLRVSGFEDLSPAKVATACSKLLPALGESDDAINAAAKDAASSIEEPDTEKLVRLLDKVSQIAEKIQKNTSKMIADEQFLSQDQLARLIVKLCSTDLSSTLNGKVIPGDRVFYPVRPHIGAQVPAVSKTVELGARTVVIVVGAADKEGCNQAAALAERAEGRGAKAVLVVDKGVPDEYHALLSGFHMHTANIADHKEISRMLKAATSIGSIACVIHITGNMPPNQALHSLARADWDALVERFVCAPARTMRAAMEHYVPGGSQDPRLYKDVRGAMSIVGPAILAGKKVPRDEAVRAEVFRGALRPLVTTINQELSDVLGSNLRLFLLLPGSVGGKSADNAKLADALDYAISDESLCSSEVIFCTDERRA